MQADTKCVTPEKIKAGLIVLNYTTTRVPTNTKKAIRTVMHVCDGNTCVNAVLIKQQVIIVHSEAISLCRECHTVDMGREDISSTLKKHKSKKMPNSMFVHMLCLTHQENKTSWSFKKVRFLQACTCAKPWQCEDEVKT